MKQRQKRAAVVVAHPDDETLFFAGLILRYPYYHWTVISVTSGGYIGKTVVRELKLMKACHYLGVQEVSFLGFSDKPKIRLPVSAIVRKLKQQGSFDFVYTHGVRGDYGHKHHEDVSYATHQAFCDSSKVYSVANKQNPIKSIRLNTFERETKKKILYKIYKEDLKNFSEKKINIFREGFVLLSKDKSRKVYKQLTIG